MPRKQSRKSRNTGKKIKQCQGCLAPLPPCTPDVDFANLTAIRREGRYNVEQVFSAQQLLGYHDYKFAELKPAIKECCSRGSLNEKGVYVRNPRYNPELQSRAYAFTPPLLLVANPGFPPLSERKSEMLVEFLLHRRDFYVLTGRYMDRGTHREYLRHGQDEWAVMDHCPALHRWKEAVKPAEEGYDSSDE